MQFSDDDLKIFRDVSHDRSPIHWDRAYARRTPLGAPVVYGIAAVVYGLGRWANGRSFRLATIRGRFNRALYTGVDYEYRIKETGEKVEIRLLRKGSTLMEFTFEWEDWEGQGDSLAIEVENGFSPLSSANTDPAVPPTQCNVTYFCNPQALDRFQSRYRLAPGQLPYVQLLALLWSSYQVGMVWPGSQALYTSFAMGFDAKLPDRPVLKLEQLDYQFDDRFDMATMNASSPGMDIEILAFMRPAFVDYSLAEIRESVVRDDSLAGKRVLVVGASRGFGSVLSRAFLLKSASVVINYRTEDDAVSRLREQLRDYEDKCFFLKADISNDSDCEQLFSGIEKSFGKLDFLVCNASPPIIPYPFMEMETEEFTGFISQSVSICHRPFSILNPLFDEHATVINISSVYAKKPPRKFSHYVSAKWAVEGMTHALASEFPDLNFVVARLPRMLTDQTNTNLDFEKKVSAVTVASQLLERVLQSGEFSSPLVLDFEE